MARPLPDRVPCTVISGVVVSECVLPFCTVRAPVIVPPLFLTYRASASLRLRPPPELPPVWSVPHEKRPVVASHINLLVPAVSQSTRPAPEKLRVA